MYLKGISEKGKKLSPEKNEVLILGGGLTGLSAGYVLSKAGFGVKVFERDLSVGGLSKTVVHGGFCFDLGGHRFIAQAKAIDEFVRNIMGDELVLVPRKSKIYMRNRYFDYPLRPLNAMVGMGIPTTFGIILDYCAEKFKRLFKESPCLSLEDWVVSNFGRKMFDIYFKVYSEKVWGIECKRISAEWVAQRIKGLSLAKAIKNAFFRLNGKGPLTLADSFLYPQMGIGRISERLKEEINKENTVFTDTSVECINHSDFNIDSIVVKNQRHSSIIYGKEFISSIPITKLIGMLNPSPPENILKAASQLRFRNLIVVAIMLDRKNVTDQTWIYIPEQQIPFGRVHEPTNWSRKMAPEGKTLIVAEYFSFTSDPIWGERDGRIVEMSIKNLEELGFIKKEEVIDSTVVRVPNAYPLFEIGYKELCNVLFDYLDMFKNLHLAGRSGMFRYYNMDHAIASGIETAERIIQKQSGRESHCEESRKNWDDEAISKKEILRYAQNDTKGK